MLNREVGGRREPGREGTGEVGKGDDNSQVVWDWNEMDGLIRF